MYDVYPPNKLSNLLVVLYTPFKVLIFECLFILNLYSNKKSKL